MDLLTTFEVGQAYKTLMVRYILVDADTSYNLLIGRCTLNQLGAVVSTPHMAMKFAALNGTIITIKADPKEAQQCYMYSLKITPYSLKTIEERATQIEELETPLAECNNVVLEGGQQSETETVTGDTIGDGVDLDPRAEFEEGRPTFDEPMTTVRLGAGFHHVTRMGLRTHKQVRDDVERVLISNSDLFAWSPTDMPGIDPGFMCHRLALLP